MEKWKAAMQLGNECFEECRYEDAIQHYQRAKQRVTRLFAEWFERDDIVAALVVAHQNIADALVVQEQYAQAESELRCGYEFLAQQVVENRDPDNLPSLQRGVSKLHQSLNAHYKAHGATLSKPVCPCKRSRRARSRPSYSRSSLNVSVQ